MTRFSPQFTFTNKDVDIEKHIRWCRINLGERGRDWDFAGNSKRIQMWVNEHSSKFSFFQLKYGNLRQR